ncbi:Rha family transcriptional regulator [Methylocucumis oryzae]|uniref:Rha family transcriptional regulator n=1 Tax=Methylocucumis oryzae TaxID=1632867 RepID=UPI0012FF3450|nr:Rha family transcriptional regulator [Methylocucumis oryzae]
MLSIMVGGVWEAERPAGSRTRSANPNVIHRPLFSSTVDGLKNHVLEFIMINHAQVAPVAQTDTEISGHIIITDGQPTTTTQDIADVYGKRHDDVLRIVRKRMIEAGEWGVRNFAETPYINSQNGQTYPVIRMTKKGFHFVVGKFTGAKVVQHQIAFADEFERMEAELKAVPNTPEPDFNVSVQNGVTLTLRPLAKGELIKRWLVTLHGNNMVQAWAVGSPNANASAKPERRYHYPRRLPQPAPFSSENQPTGFNLALQGHNQHFVSPLFALLNELRADGHDISAPWDEAVAMREALQRMNHVCQEMIDLAMKVQQGMAVNGRGV